MTAHVDAIMGIGRMWLGLIALALLLVSCSEDTPTAVVEPDLTVSTTVRFVEATQEIEVTVVNNDVNDKVVKFQHDYIFGYSVIDNYGDVVISYPQPPWVAGPRTLDIAAGETVTMRMVLPVLPPETFVVWAGIQEHEERYPWASTSFTIAPSSPLLTRRHGSE